MAGRSSTCGDGTRGAAALGNPRIESLRTGGRVLPFSRLPPTPHQAGHHPGHGTCRSPDRTGRCRYSPGFGIWHSRLYPDLFFPTRGSPGSCLLPDLRFLEPDRGADRNVTNRCEVFCLFGSSQRPNTSYWNVMPAPFSTPRDPCVDLRPAISLLTADNGVNVRGTRGRRIRQPGTVPNGQSYKAGGVIDLGLPLQRAAVHLHARLFAKSGALLPWWRSARGRHPDLAAEQHGMR